MEKVPAEINLKCSLPHFLPIVSGVMGFPELNCLI